VLLARHLGKLLRVDLRVARARLRGRTTLFFDLDETLTDIHLHPQSDNNLKRCVRSDFTINRSTHNSNRRKLDILLILGLGYGPNTVWKKEQAGQQAGFDLGIGVCAEFYFLLA
jgi:hypothetical protein